jgi:hypothetical protein
MIALQRDGHLQRGQFTNTQSDQDTGAVVDLSSLRSPLLLKPHDTDAWKHIPGRPDTNLFQHGASARTFLPITSAGVAFLLPLPLS